MATPVVVSRIQNRRGLQSQFELLYPPGYTGIGGYGSIPGFDSLAYPDVLLPGEIALCTDSRRIFVGNINGEYLRMASDDDSGGIVLNPLTIQLPPVSTFTTISGLTYMPGAATPFMTIFYGLTDSLESNWNTPGTAFSRNGTFQITCVKSASPAPTATLTDSGTEINTTSSVISFIAVYNAGNTFIEIQYKHDFPAPLTFNSRSLDWQIF